jgi:hypothetical protein
MQDTPKKLPPYVPYKTLMTFLAHLRAIGIPSHIDKSVMSNMSGGIQSWLRAALKYMDLVTATDTPTKRLEELVMAEGEQRKALLSKLFADTYAFLDGKVDLKNTTPVKLREAVVAQGAQGETVEKIIAFMIAMAKDAGIPLSKLLTTRAVSVRRPRVKTPAARSTQNDGDGGDDEDDNETDASSAAMKVISLPNAGGTLTLSGNINIFALMGAERDLVFALIDTMRKFEESQEGAG